MSSLLNEFHRRYLCCGTGNLFILFTISYCFLCRNRLNECGFQLITDFIFLILYNYQINFFYFIALLHVAVHYSSTFKKRTNFRCNKSPTDIRGVTLDQMKQTYMQQNVVDVFLGEGYDIAFYMWPVNSFF